MFDLSLKLTAECYCDLAQQVELFPKIFWVCVTHPSGKTAQRKPLKNSAAHLSAVWLWLDELPVYWGSRYFLVSSHLNGSWQQKVKSGFCWSLSKWMSKISGSFSMRPHWKVIPVPAALESWRALSPFHATNHLSARPYTCVRPPAPFFSPCSPPARLSALPPAVSLKALYLMRLRRGD